MTQHASPVDRLNAVSEQGLCIGCGLCEAIAGASVVRCVETDGGVERPVVVGELTAETMDAIASVCPGLRVTGVSQGSGWVDPVWGPWIRISRAWAGDPDVRHIGSTGGALTALGMHLLDTGEVDAVLHAGPSRRSPGFGDSCISRTSAQLLDRAGSRYGPTAVLRRLDEALAGADRIAVIAKPCDLSALQLRALDDDRISGRVRYRLTMMCGGIMTPGGLAERMGWFDVDPATVTAIRYRGHGCPGPTRFERADGEPVEVSYLDFWGDDDSKWSIPYRCKICPDGSGEVADIVAADTWLGGSPTEQQALTDPGVNVVMARTERGAQLLDRAEASGHLGVGPPATIEDLDAWQPHLVRKKKMSWARQLGRRRAGGTPIELVDLRAEHLARTIPCRVLLDEAHGSAARVRGGRAIEPTPRAARS